MTTKQLIEALQTLKLPESHVLLALPGGRFSPATLVEPFMQTDARGKAVSVVLVYPHPRDVAALPGPAEATESPLKGVGEVINKLFDLMGATDGSKPDEE
jgi:hypothetical protein